jgi:predicted O-linked N-acetylglucosamine transferase (SPINDLY family)
MANVNLKEMFSVAAEHYLAGHRDKAAATYRRILKIEPSNADALHLLGKMDLIQGRYDSAIDFFDRSLEASAADDLRLRLASYNLRGETLRAQGRFSDALLACRQALDLNPNYTPALINMAAALRQLGRLDEALACLDRVIEIEPESAEAHNNRGIVLRQKGDSREAVAAFSQALLLNPRLIQAHNSLANELRNLGNLEEAIASYERALTLQPDSPAILVNLFQVLSYACAWDRRRWVAGRLAKVTRDQIERGALATESPFVYSLRGEDPGLLHDVAVAAATAAARKAPTPRSDWHDSLAVDRSSSRLRIGYLVDGLDNQPARRKLLTLAQHHDRGRFAVFAYCGGNDLDRQSTIEAACDGYANLKSMDDIEAAKRIAADGIDILVDLAGHQPGGRLGIVAQRPAPIQLVWPNLPVTTGPACADYFVTDNVTVPPAAAAHFDEGLLYLPAGHQALGHEALPVPDAPDRQAHGLPVAGVVFACFGRALRFDPLMFGAWMQILDAVEGSVLWLGRTNRVTVLNLKAETEKAGIDPERVMFAGRSREKTAHMARLRCVDVWLDTRRQSSDMAMLDALWAGVPAVTLAGATAPARGGASLLRAAGLDHLIADTPRAYAAKAVELARDSGQRADIAVRLAAGRELGALFDKAVVISRFEQMLERISGEPQRFPIPRMTLPAQATTTGAALQLGSHR